MNESLFYSLFSVSVRRLLQRASPDLQKLQEVRLRAEKPLLLRFAEAEYAVTEEGDMTHEIANAYCVSNAELQETLSCIAGYSLYAFDEEMRQGFLTVDGGHRVGIAGKAVMDDGRIRCMRHISFLNIRLSHEMPGCADRVLPYLVQDGELCHTLILSPPGCGKTTLLRDLVRQISNGTEVLSGRTVGVVDERSEIAGCYLGIPQNDVGIRTDVLDGCSKTEGMMMLLRAMSPQVIAVDELGGIEDRQAVEAVFHCGCRLLATIHGSSVEDLKQRPLLRHMAEQKLFERYVLLDHSFHTGAVKSICNADGIMLYGREEGKV